MSLVGNERIKLMANALDRVSTVCLTVGFAAPIGNWMCGGMQVSLPHLLAGGYVWICVAAGLNNAARRTLGMLEE
jgi:hypothetical protein